MQSGEAGKRLRARRAARVPLPWSGSSVAGAVIQCYVVEYRKEGAPEVLVPYTLTLVDGKVIHVD